ncbi:hypothetical protein ACFVUS_27225 [Nocardia sp. NPDC058058]|uniref:hypothetical protein n=1 Tax=Nocardia sp. NPDC058058 TaxID=3346317 RepID=UPI0036DD53B0
MNIRDSSGVNLSNYMFVTHTSGFMPPDTYGLAMAIQLEFAGWMLIVVTGIWLIGFVLSFRWMALFATPLRAIARGFSEQVSIPIVLITGASIGAFCVAWFVIRGLHAKAVIQIVTMIAVAVLGPMFLADPLADVLDSDGWFSQGRDLGIAIAAGLNGDRSPQPDAVVESVDVILADNFGRKELHLWNFEHLIDERPVCGAAWSTTLNTGDGERVREAIHSCGDSQAYAATRKPSPLQFGAGLIFLISGAGLLGFGVRLAISIVGSVVEVSLRAFKVILGFAAGGFIYGPTQTMLVRDVVHAFFAALRMAALVTFLGVYVLFLGNIFEHARGHEMSVLIMAVILEFLAITQLKRLNASLDRGNDWVANRFSQTLHGVDTTRISGGGATAGMGTIGTHHNGLGMLATLGAINTVGNSIVAERLLGKRSPLRLDANAETIASRAQWGVWSVAGLGGPMGWQIQAALNRQLWAGAAREGALMAGGINTVRGAAMAIQHAVDQGASPGDLNGALQGAGFTDVPLVQRAINSWGIVMGNVNDRKISDERLAGTVAAMARVEYSSDGLVSGGSGGREPHNPHGVAADLATLQAAAYRFRRANQGDITLDDGHKQGPQRKFVDAYMAGDRPRERIEQLGTILTTGTLGQETPPDGSIAKELLDANVQLADAQRMWAWIGNKHAMDIHGSVEQLIKDPTNRDFHRAVSEHLAETQDTEVLAKELAYSPWKQLARPGSRLPDGDWTKMDQVKDLL